MGYDDDQEVSFLRDDNASLRSRLASSEAKVARLEKALIQAEMAMQSAWYELDPGKAVIGDQFIKQVDMDEKLAIVRAALAAKEGKG